MDTKTPSFNYIYFGAFFSLLLLIIASSLFHKEPLSGSHWFFFPYAIGQAIFETSLLVFLAFFVRKYLGKLFFTFFIGATFIGAILHVLDFLMDRILDLSVFEALDVFVFRESWGNFLHLLDASGIPRWEWLLLALLCVSLPCIGIMLFHWSEKWTARKPIDLGATFFLQALICIPLALLFWDISASTVIHPDAYTAFKKSLPWKSTFLKPQNLILPIGNMNFPVNEREIEKKITESKVINEKPNIFLFVIESLREDAITQNIAPHLCQFKQNNCSFDLAVSNGNASHISWFSLFHSQYPYFWSEMQKRRQMGSPALYLLKKWGYKIHVYSSAQLNYYNMKESIFGANCHLADRFFYFPHTRGISAAESDAKTLEQLQLDLADPTLKQGQIFIVFWDATHFDYSWPKNWIPKFTPFAHELAYFKTFQSKQGIGQIKNRYFNAVNYIDHLFGKFLAKMQDSDSVVIVTGDHGEEFFEHGHLFHNSHLTQEQMHIPIYLKLGKNEKSVAQTKLISQMDVFPTVIDYLGGDPSFLAGHSVLKTNIPVSVTARFNGGLTPYQFCIHNGDIKLIAQFDNRKNIFASKNLEILSLRKKDDTPIFVSKNDIKTCVQEMFCSQITQFGADPKEP